MSKQTITQQHDYEGIEIQQHGNQGAIKEILDGQTKRLDYMCSRYAHVGVAHLVVTLPDDTSIPQDNKLIGDSIRAMRKTMQNHGVETQTGWVREVAHTRNDNKPHYHVGVIFNARTMQSSYEMAQQLNDLVTKRTNQPTDSVYVKSISPSLDCQAERNQRGTSILKIRKGKEGEKEQRNNALNWLSYQAKVDSKDTTMGIRTYGFSQLPSKRGKK